MAVTGKSHLNHRHHRHCPATTALAAQDSRSCSELWACVVCPDLVLHVFSPDGARIYMDELLRVRDMSSKIPGSRNGGSWSPNNVGTNAK
jgi:hypothetical protein